jgi:hypothetical protein
LAFPPKALRNFQRFSREDSSLLWIYQVWTEKSVNQDTLRHTATALQLPLTLPNSHHFTETSLRAISWRSSRKPTHSSTKVK